MKLFSFVPPNFFAVLSGPLKQLHIELLNLVYQQYRKSIYMIDREILIDLFSEYLETTPIDPTLYNDEENHLLPQDIRERALYFLRKFIETGWIMQEQKLDYTFQISVPDYASRLLDTFEKIVTGYQIEYGGHVLSIFQNLTGEENASYFALHRAYETTLTLIDGLKQLNHNIKNYTERLLKTSDVKGILEQVFDDYEINVLGTQYYRLKTSDHVSKYRTRIIDAIRSWQFNAALIGEQANQMVKDKQSKTKTEAENYLYDWINTIESSFSKMDEILEEIDTRNRQYARSAIQMIRYHLLQTESSTSKLNQILLYIATKIKDEGEKGYLDEFINSELSIYHQEYIEESSIRIPTIIRREMQKPTKLIKKETNPNKKKQNLQRFKKRVKQEVTIKQINEHVSNTLDDKESLALAEFPLQSKKDWLNLIYTILYSSSRKAEYELSKRNNNEKVKEVTGGLVPNRSVKKRGIQGELDRRLSKSLGKR